MMNPDLPRPGDGSVRVNLIDGTLSNEIIGAFFGVYSEQGSGSASTFISAHEPRSSGGLEPGKPSRRGAIRKNPGKSEPIT
jgi:hypothetical protein